MATQGTCACGIFAIGQCSQCGRPVCGVHGKLFEGRLTCVDDIQAAQTKARQDAEAAQLAAEKATDAQTAERIVGQVRAGSDGISRWLLAREAPWGTFKHQDARKTCLGVVRELVSGVAGGELVKMTSATPESWTVSDADLLKWLSARRKPDAVMHAGTLRTMKGWIIGEGSQYIDGDYRSGGSTFYYRVFVATDGRVFQVNKNENRIPKWRLKSPSTLGLYASHLAKLT